MLLGVLLSCRASFAQPAAPSSTNSTNPPLRRWFDLQTFTVYTRYHFVVNSLDKTTADQQQYKDSLRGRFNIDSKKRYTITFGSLSGSTFISSWLATGAGTGDFNGKDHYFRQLYGSAMPVDGVELQGGGLYISRGESDEFTTYDDDGYVVGERVSVRRPRALWLDDISVTRGALGPSTVPNLWKRWDDGFNHPNYTQVIGTKSFSHYLGGSLDYTTVAGADTIRAAVTVHLNAGAPVNTVRYEQYRRTRDRPASGFAVWADRGFGPAVRLQAGYITIDQFYGGLNADRVQSGRRFFANAVVRVYGPLSVTFYETDALHSDYLVSLKRRFDAVLSYDVLRSLQRTGIF